MIIKLCQYSAWPAKIHFDAIMDLFAYLQDMKNEGIYYWCDKPRMNLYAGDI